MPGGRGRGVAAAVTRDQIVDVAEEIARRDGLDAVSVRRVSAALGVTPAALYWHLRNKDDLVAALVDRASARTARSSARGRDWLTRLVDFHLATRAEFTAIPGLAAALMTMEPTEATLGNCLYVLDLLFEGGFDEEQAILVFDTLSNFSWGHMMMIDMARRAARVSVDKAISAHAGHVASLMEGRPEYAAFVRSLGRFDDAHSRRQFARGIEVLVRGAQAPQRRGT